MVVLCPVPEPGGRGRWQVSRAGPPFPRQPPGQLRFGEERGSRPLRLGWRHPPESWRNIYHVSNQISLIRPRVSQCTKALCCNRAWDIRGRGRDVSKTNRAVRGLLKELLLAWVFRLFVWCWVVFEEDGVEGQIGSVCASHRWSFLVFEVEDQL